jgi:hypothetical protein
LAAPANRTGFVASISLAYSTYARIVGALKGGIRGVNNGFDSNGGILAMAAVRYIVLIAFSGISGRTASRP